MNKHCVIVTAVLLFLFLAGSLSAQEIPAALQARGFTQDMLVSYDKDGDEEFYTFYDLESGDHADTITFIIEKGTIVQTIKGQTAKFQDR